jgi:hypothetical protein
MGESKESEGPQEPKDSLVDLLKEKGTVDFSLEKEASKFSTPDHLLPPPRDYYLIATYYVGEEQKQERTKLVFTLPGGTKVSKLGLGSWLKKWRYKALANSLMSGVKFNEVTTAQLDKVFHALDERLSALAEQGVNVGKVGTYENVEAFRKAYSKVAPKKD